MKSPSKNTINEEKTSPIQILQNNYLPQTNQKIESSKIRNNHQPNQRTNQILEDNNENYSFQSFQPLYIPNKNLFPYQTNPISQRFGGMTYVSVSDPLIELNNCSEVLIKQEPELLKILTGYETPNRYHVFGLTNSGYIYLFKCFEKSKNCIRCFCPSSMRNFNMEIRHCGSVDEMKPEMSKLFANIYKPFKCSCFCFNRPEMFIKLSNGEFLGKIFYSFSFCDPEQKVYDNNQQLKYFVNADYCQCGLLCANGICGKCSEVKFSIFDKKYGKEIGIIAKNPAEIIEIISSADSYKIIFPNMAKAKEKLELICLCLMIDYQHFEENNSKS